MTRARADQGAEFKRCCMLSGELDGGDRDHFFQRMTTFGRGVTAIVGGPS